MQTYRPATPFGRRSLSIAQMSAQISIEPATKAATAGKTVDKWKVFRAICAARKKIGVTSRSLCVLEALLTFHPDKALSGDALIVFPSNESLSLRAHGMAPATLRRHIAALVDAGLIARRDSPNGKRYARRDSTGAILRAFGFDLRPLLARADQFQTWADALLAEERAIKILRETLSLCRRDIDKMLALGSSQAQARVDANENACWLDFYTKVRAVAACIPRHAPSQILERFVQDMTALAAEISRALQEQNSLGKNSSKQPENICEMSAIAAQNEQHIQNPKIHSSFESEENGEKKNAALFPRSHVPRPNVARHHGPQTKNRAIALNDVLRACPDIADYRRGGIADWRDLSAAIAVVRPMLRINDDVWRDAQTNLGAAQAEAAVAVLLQKGEAIQNAGGYLRRLSQTAAASGFSVQPMLFALLAQQTRQRSLAEK